MQDWHSQGSSGKRQCGNMSLQKQSLPQKSHGLKLDGGAWLPLLFVFLSFVFLCFVFFLGLFIVLGSWSSWPAMLESISIPRYLWTTHGAALLSWIPWSNRRSRCCYQLSRRYLLVPRLAYHQCLRFTGEILIITG